MNIVGAIGYGIAAAAFMLLAVLMMVSWRGRPQGVYLISASVITGAWALLLAGQAFVGRSPMLPLYVAETLRNGAWLYALCSIAANNAPRGLIRLARAAPILALLAIPVLSFLENRGVTVLPPELLLSRMGLATSLLGLILLEQIYRNSGEATRDSLKYFVCGVGALFAYDLFLYSQAELLRGIMADAWNARGAIIAFAAPLTAIAVQRRHLTGVASRPAAAPRSSAGRPQRGAADRDRRATPAAMVARRVRVAAGGVLHDDLHGRRCLSAADGGGRLLRAPVRRQLGASRADRVLRRRAAGARAAGRLTGAAPARARLSQ